MHGLVFCPWFYFSSPLALHSYVEVNVIFGRWWICWFCSSMRVESLTIWLWEGALVWEHLVVLLGNVVLFICISWEFPFLCSLSTSFLKGTGWCLDTKFKSNLNVLGWVLLIEVFFVKVVWKKYLLKVLHNNQSLDCFYHIEKCFSI